jgi:hypothetical protein
MHLCKYRDLSSGSERQLQRVVDILDSGGFWCAAPSTLNDPDEFIWECNFQPTEQTAHLLANVLTLNMPVPKASAVARAVVSEGRLESYVRPLLEAMMAQCRSEVGLACFCTSSDNSTMWERYGGTGNGICIELDAPDELLNSHLHPVHYVTPKHIHIDAFLSSMSDRSSTEAMYRICLLTKSTSWADESEIRFVSKTQNVLVRVHNARISRLLLGDKLDQGTAARLESHCKQLPYKIEVGARGA